LDFSILVGKTTTLDVTLNMARPTGVTAHFFRGGKEIDSRRIVSGNPFNFTNETGFTAVIFVAEQATTINIKDLQITTDVHHPLEADPLSQRENILIARETAPDWGAPSSILRYGVFEWHLAQYGVHQHRGGYHGARAGQYYLLGLGDDTYQQYTFYTPSSNQGSPALGDVLFMNDDGFHPLPKQYYTLAHGGLIVHPGAPRSLAVKVQTGNDVTVGHNETADDIDELLALSSEFRPGITVQKLYLGSHPDPGFHAGINAIKDGETPVFFHGQPFHALATVHNPGGHSGKLTIDVYAGPESDPLAHHAGTYSTHLGAYENKTLIVNAVSPDGEGRPSISLVVTLPSGEQYSAGKHARKAGRSQADAPDSNRDNAQLIEHLPPEAQGGYLINMPADDRAKLFESVSPQQRFDYIAAMNQAVIEKGNDPRVREIARSRENDGVVADIRAGLLHAPIIVDIGHGETVTVEVDDITVPDDLPIGDEALRETAIKLHKQDIALVNELAQAFTGMNHADPISQLEQLMNSTIGYYDKEVITPLEQQLHELRSLKLKITASEMLFGVFKNQADIIKAADGANARQFGQLVGDPIGDAVSASDALTIDADDSELQAWGKTILMTALSYKSPSFYADAVIRLFWGDGKNIEEILAEQIRQADRDRDAALSRIELQIQRLERELR